MILIPWVRGVTGLSHEIFEGAQDVLGGVGGMERPKKYMAANGQQQCDGFHGLSFVIGFDVPGVWKKKSPVWHTGLRGGATNFAIREKRLVIPKPTTWRGLSIFGDRRPEIANSST